MVNYTVELWSLLPQCAVVQVAAKNVEEACAKAIEDDEAWENSELCYDASGETYVARVVRGHHHSPFSLPDRRALRIPTKFAGDEVKRERIKQFIFAWHFDNGEMDYLFYYGETKATDRQIDRYLRRVARREHEDAAREYYIDIHEELVGAALTFNELIKKG